MMCVQLRALGARRATGALLAAMLAVSCAEDRHESQADADDEVTLWPIPDVGLDGGRLKSDAAIGPSLDRPVIGLDASRPRPDAGSDAAIVEPDTSVMGSCGDGKIDRGRGEHCDDANHDDGDGCNNECHESARLIWSHDTEPNVFATTLAVDDAGAIAIGGNFIRSAGGSDLWVNKYSAEGTSAWSRAQTLDLGHDEGASAVSFAPGGDVVVLGSSQVLGDRTPSEILLTKHAGADGTSRWAAPFRAMAGPQHIGTSLLVTASERIYASATFYNEGRLDVWLQAFNPTGSPAWTNALQLNEGQGEFPGAFWLASDGALRAYWAATPGPRMELVLADLSADAGSVTTVRHTALSQMSISNSLYFAVDAKGGVVVCANVLMGDRRALWMQKFSLEGAPVWAKEVLESAEDTLQCSAVALDRTGNVAVSGSLGKAERIWLRLYGSDGQPLWHMPVVYDGGYQAIPAGVGFDTDGNVIAAGVRRTVQNYSFLWFAKYAR